MSSTPARAAIMAFQPAWMETSSIAYVYGDERIARMAAMTSLHPVQLTAENFEAELPHLGQVEVLFATWGMPKLTEAQLDRLPNLKVVFYAAGSVNAFAGPLVARGIAVCSAVEANAIPVAEFCLAQILLSCKNYFANTRLCRQGPWKDKINGGRGVYGETVALLGIGAISRHLLTLLKPINLRVVAVSNYLASRPVDEVKTMGIDQLVSLEEAFREGYIISNHLPDKPSNQYVIRAEHFASMRQNAVFINTGRGAQVHEEGLIEVFSRRTDLTALLDVQYPEPPRAESPLYRLPNVQLSAHIAGSAGDEVRRMADFMIEDFARWQAGKTLQHQVDPKELATRA